MSKAAAIIVDMQKGLVEGHPYQEEIIVENIQNIADECRNKGIEIIYVKHKDENDDEIKPGTPGFDIIEALAPKENEKIFEKSYNSAFRNTGLKEYLSQKGIDKLIIMGMQTEYCMDATIKAAFEYGFYPLVPEETNTTFDNEFLTASQTVEYCQYKIWDQRYAYVTNWNAVEFFWWNFLCEAKLPIGICYYEAFCFASTENMENDPLKRVLSGQKRAIVSSLLSYEDENALPKVGDYSIVTNWDGEPQAIIEITGITILPFCDVTNEMCSREGEEDSLELWKERYTKVFAVEGEEVGYEFNKDMLIVYQDFNVVYQG